MNFISIIIPCREINHYILEENLPALNNLYVNSFEVIILPNKTNQIDKSLLAKYPWLIILPTQKIDRPAEKRDFGVKHAKAIVVFGGENDVLHAGFRCGVRPFLRIEL
jgi:hypothetical protein